MPFSERQLFTDDYDDDDNDGGDDLTAVLGVHGHESLSVRLEETAEIQASVSILVKVHGSWLLREWEFAG